MLSLSVASFLSNFGHALWKNDEKKMKKKKIENIFFSSKRLMKCIQIQSNMEYTEAAGEKRRQKKIT